MKTGDCCNRVVLVTKADTGIRETAELLRKSHCGSVVVVRDDGTGAHPVGIITDRDLVVEVLACGIAPEQVSAGDVMSGDLVLVGEDEEVVEAAARMRKAGVRRAPVVDGQGRLVGIVTLDDLLDFTAKLLGVMASMVRREIATEAAHRT
ncbi:MAG: CBS domain-containing protein [Nevskia sp.]|nr:CBS domain-containing protein [Nevskia sp.]